MWFSLSIHNGHYEFPIMRLNTQLPPPPHLLISIHDTFLSTSTHTNSTRVEADVEDSKEFSFCHPSD